MAEARHAAHAEQLVTTAADARNRSARTVVQGLGIDVAVAVVLVLVVAGAGLEWTRAYWVALGLSLGRTVVQAAVAYFFRLLVPPGTPAK